MYAKSRLTRTSRAANWRMLEFARGRPPAPTESHPFSEVTCLLILQWITQRLIRGQSHRRLLTRCFGSSSRRLICQDVCALVRTRVPLRRTPHGRAAPWSRDSLLGDAPAHRFRSHRSQADAEGPLARPPYVRRQPTSTDHEVRICGRYTTQLVVPGGRDRAPGRLFCLVVAGRRRVNYVVTLRVYHCGSLHEMCAMRRCRETNTVRLLKWYLLRANAFHTRLL